MNSVKNFWNDESGLELSEYAVGAALIAVAVAVAFTALGTAIKNRIDALTNILS
jgi:Flp pilus assembly pilin Flp